MAKTAELKAVLSLDNSHFVRGVKAAAEQARRMAAQFKAHPIKFVAAAGVVGAEKTILGMKNLGMAAAGAAATGLRSLAVAAPVAAGALAAGVTHAYNFGSELQDMSDRTGIGVKQLVILQTALKDAGVEFNALLPAIGKKIGRAHV